MRTKRLILGAGLMVAAGMAPVYGQGAEDVGAGGGRAPTGTLAEIGAPTVPMVVFDFDTMAAGPVTVADIQAAFALGNALMDITNTPRMANGTYDFQTGGGRALTAATDGSGDLLLVDPLASFGEVDSFTIVYNMPATEFGFEIGDWGGPFNLECFDGITSVGTVQVDTTLDDREHFVQSVNPFDSCVLTALPDNPPANWVIPSFQIPESAVPVTLMEFDSK